MGEKELSKEQKKEREDWLRSYKFVYICKKCGAMYGTDLEEKIVICPACYNKFRKMKSK